MQSNLEAAAQALGMALGVWLNWILIALIVKNFICALFCASLAGSKGYSALLYFFVGILFGELALLYMVGMPLSFEEERHRQMQLAVVLAEAGFVPSLVPDEESDEPQQTEPPKPIMTQLGDLDTNDFDAD